jgi:hypothetical protein
MRCKANREMRLSRDHDLSTMRSAILVRSIRIRMVRDVLVAEDFYGRGVWRAQRLYFHRDTFVDALVPFHDFPRNIGDSDRVLFLSFSLYSGDLLLAVYSLNVYFN